MNPAQDFVKRVVALPGDRLRLINKRVYINGALVAEPYTQYIPRAPQVLIATTSLAPNLPITEWMRDGGNKCQNWWRITS